MQNENQSSRYDMQLHHDMLKSHALCFRLLGEAYDELDVLRLEIARLKQQLSLLMRSSDQNQLDSNPMPFQLLGDLIKDIRSKAPMSVIERKNLEISSSLLNIMDASCDEHLDANVVGGAGGKSLGPIAKPGTSSQPTRFRDEAVELEVKQGMLKTELCKNWEETASCPYGDHCQFAHGTEELRQVIRHPLYKTDLCKYVRDDVVCPYGPRCHFHHP